jgi:hypothetical protein
MRIRQQEQIERRRQIEMGEGEENQEDEFFEYEPASEEEEEKQDHDYNYEKEEFLNPVIIKMPDGTLNIGTESKDKQIVNHYELICVFRKKYFAGIARVDYYINIRLTKLSAISATKLLKLRSTTILM